MSILKKLIIGLCSILILIMPVRVLLNYLFIRLNYSYVKLFVKCFDKCRIKKSFYWRDEFLDREIIYPVSSDYQKSWNVALSTRWHEPNVRRFIEFFISNNVSDKVFFDIGSNHGLFSFPFLAYSYVCFLFEPQRVCNEYVEEVAKMNSFEPNVLEYIVLDKDDSGSEK